MRHQQAYATIDEAWGDHLGAKKTIIKHDPPSPTPPPIVVAAETKSPVGAPAHLDHGDDEVEREATMRSAMVVEPSLVDPPEKEDHEEKHKNVHENFAEESDIDRKYTQYMEFAVYVFSGIVLMFLLEQFVQMGIAMRK